MEIFQLLGLALVGTLLTVFVRERNKEFGLLVSLLTGLLLLMLLIEPVSSILMGINELAAKGKVNLVYITTVLKVTGIALITEFGAQLCRDSGEGAIAKKVEAGGKLLILLLALPIFNVILDSLLSLLP
jgi:stage III sporulation protein AD